jgi:predicted RNase H-like nuclease
MKHSKATADGRRERLDVLQRYEPGIPALLEDVLSKTFRKHVQVDDVLDAAVAFVTAEARQGELVSLVGMPSHDEVGLPIEIVYLRTWDEVA